MVQLLQLPVGGLNPKQLGSIVFDLIILGFKPRHELLDIMIEGEMAVCRVQELREALGALLEDEGEGARGMGAGVGEKGGTAVTEDKRLGRGEVGYGDLKSKAVKARGRGGTEGGVSEEQVADWGGDSNSTAGAAVSGGGGNDEVDWDAFIDAATKGFKT